MKKAFAGLVTGQKVHIRQQAERLVKFVFSSEQILAAAVSTQPFKALAWSGTSMFLSVRDCKHSTEDAELGSYLQALHQ